jgi:glycosyltransferase involved in cell wall biosynthesis
VKLSVALCTYNGAAFLPVQLDSLVGQCRRPDELVVCDDRSRDETVPLLERFAAAAPFPVRLHQNTETLRSTRNFDQAIGRCSGDVIFLCDQDDVWEPDKLARFEAAFAEGPDVGLVASDLAVMDPAGKDLGRRVWDDIPFTPVMQAAVEAGAGPRLWVRFNTITGAAAAFRSDLRPLLLPIPGAWVHDGWVALLAAAVSAVRLLRDPLTRYRTHPGQQIGSSRLSLARQFRTARRMDAAYFANTAACFTAAAERLEQFRDRVKDPGVIDLLRAKAAFARTQQRMREGPQLGRVLPALRLLLTGDYARLGRGWKAFAADLLL